MTGTNGHFGFNLVGALKAAGYHVRGSVRSRAEASKTVRLKGIGGVVLVTILPGGITGPAFARNTPTIDLIEPMMLGLMRLGVPDYAYPIVGVRDVAAAHLLAAQQDCSGRFIACNDDVPTLRKMIQTRYAIDLRAPLPLMTMPDWFGAILWLFDRINSRLLRASRTALRRRRSARSRARPGTPAIGVSGSFSDGASRCLWSRARARPRWRSAHCAATEAQAVFPA